MAAYRLPTERHLDKIDERDKFKFELLSKQILHTIILEMESPNCFGLYGNWGSGKSTLLHFMKEHIAKDTEKCGDIETVYFEPWQYEYAADSDLIFALLRKIEKTLGTQGRNGKSFARDLLTVGTWASRELLQIDPKQIKDDMEMWEDAIHTEYERWMDRVENFQAEFRKAVANGLEKNKKKRLVVFIDDLDRCLPENAIRLLEAIKNFMYVDNTLFVIAIDRRVVSEMIEKKYGLHDGYGDEYLMKIIHYSYDLPRPKIIDLVADALNNYEITADEKERKYIADFFEEFASEPRKVKHYMYQFCMRYLFGGSGLKNFATVKSTQGGMEHTSRKMDIFVVSFLMSRYPKLFSSENAEELLRHIYQRVMDPQPNRLTDKNVEGALTAKEWNTVRLIFKFGFSDRHKDRQAMSAEQIVTAYNALRTMCSTDTQ